MNTKTKDLIHFALYTLMLSTMLFAGKAWVLEQKTINITVPAPEKDPCGYTKGHRTVAVTYKKEVKSKDLRIEYMCENGVIKVANLRGYYG